MSVGGEARELGSLGTPMVPAAPTVVAREDEVEVRRTCFCFGGVLFRVSGGSGGTFIPGGVSPFSHCLFNFFFFFLMILSI